jgi:predicted MPP superfamily phosphohydrolase
VSVWPVASPLRARLAIFAGLALTGCGGGGSPGSPTTPPSRPSVITRGPYLQHADDGVAVAWYTDVAGEGRVRYFSDAGASGEALATAGGSRREATLRGLGHGVRYSYRVYSPGGQLATAGGDQEFSFLTPDPALLRFVVFGDSGNGSPEQHAVAQAIAKEAVAPDLAMIVGDLLYPPADATSWDPYFFTPYASLLPLMRFYAALGNHDYEVLGGRSFFDTFTLPRNGPAGLTPESSYWLEQAGAQLIVHDSNLSATQLRQQSIPWHNEVVRRGATFRLVFHHHTVYSSGPNSLLEPTPQLRALLGPVYSASGVDLVFNGHEHLYERTRPVGGVVYVTTGAGGAPLYPRVATNSFTAVIANGGHSYTHVEVSGRTLRLRQMDTAGKAIDTVSFTKPVTATDPLVVPAASPALPPGWTAPGFDDRSWRQASRLTGRLQARRAFELERPGAVSDAVLRVTGASDYRVWLNGVEVARAAGTDSVCGSFEVPTGLLRDGANALALDGFASDASSRPALELMLVAPLPR